MKLKTFFKQYYLSVIVSVAILYLCFAPPSTFRGTPAIPNADKIVHFLMFFALAVAARFDFEKCLISFPKWAVCLLFPAALGLLTELCQAYIFTYRSGDWRDFSCDLAGVFIAWFLMNYFYKKK